jgi:hypothetical protein
MTLGRLAKSCDISLWDRSDIFWRLSGEGLILGYAY